jgi:hypothetical protein
MKRLVTLGAVLVALLLMVGFATTAGATDNYTDGTVGADQNGNNWGAPPEAPTMDVEEGSVCIDPPQQVWMTLHVITDGEETDSLTFEYIHTVPGYACTPYELPVCPVEEIEVYGTWNIGLGRSPSLFIDNDCPDPFGELLNVQDCATGTDLTLTNVGEAAWTVDSVGPFFGQTLEPGESSTTNMGSEAGTVIVSFGAGPKFGEESTEWEATEACPLPPVELSPPAQEVATPPPAQVTSLLADTGPIQIAGLIAVGLTCIMIGFGMTRAQKIIS